MELEEFMEQYLLRYPEPDVDSQKEKYEARTKDVRRLFLDLQKNGYTDSLTVDEARLIVLSHESGFDTAWDYRGVEGLVTGMKMARVVLGSENPR